MARKIGYELRPLPVRFWEKVNKDGPVIRPALGKCWVWVGAKRYFGHGNFWVKRKNTGAHQASWVLANGPIPRGMNVLHRCDNPPCIRPGHLFLGTLSENSRDCIKKGRFKPFGKQMNRAKNISAETTR